MTQSELVLDLVTKINNILGPKNIIAYSLGALTFYKAHTEHKLNDINKVVFLAPAFKVKYLKTLSFLTKFSLTRSFKSIAPKEYRKYPKLPVNIYKILISLGSSIDWKNHELNSLIFCSFKDQLVDYKFLKMLSEEFNLKLINLDRPTHYPHPAFQHMIFNKKFLGSCFDPMVLKIRQFFQN